MGRAGFHSIWDEPADGDENTAASARKKKLSWWEEFEREPAEETNTDKTSAEPYSYRDAFDDSDERWYRRNSFDYSRYSDYSPSRLFRSTFRGFSSGFSFNTGASADNEIKNKAIRALRVLTRNANTVADKTAKISYVIKISDGIDTNYNLADSVKGKSGKQQEQVIFVSPDTIADAKTPDEDDAAIDALTGFVLLRVQLSQSVPALVLDAINATAMPAVAATIAQLATDKTVTTPEMAENAASAITDNYAAGLIAKNLLTRIARRSVVQDWGGFAPYFVRHAKKFAATREKLTAADAILSVELLAAQVAYNMLGDDNPILVGKEVDDIVEKHLSAELELPQVLPACRALVADLRAYLAAKTEQPSAGEIENAVAELLKEIAAENSEESNAASVEAGMRDNLEELAALLDNISETTVKNTGDNRFNEVMTAMGPEPALMANLQAMQKLHDDLDQAATAIAEIKAKHKLIEGEATTPNFYATNVHCRQVTLDSSVAHASRRTGELPRKHNIDLPSLHSALNRVAATDFAAVDAKVTEYEKKLQSTSKALDDAIKAELTTARTRLAEKLTMLGAQLDITEEQLNQLIARAEAVTEKTSRMADSHARGPAVAKAAQALLDGLKAQAYKLKHDKDKLAKPADMKRMRSASSFRKTAESMVITATNASESTVRAAHHAMLHSGPTEMRDFVRAGIAAMQLSEKYSQIKISKTWHAPAIEHVMAWDSEPAPDFQTGVLIAAHKELLNKLIDKLTNNGKNGLPTSAGCDNNANNAELLKRTAGMLDMTAQELLNLLHRASAESSYGHRTNPLANKLGKAVEEQIMRLAAESNPVDEELFGGQVRNNTKTLTGESVIGVNEEALNRAEEEFVAFLSHNSSRPIIKVKKPPKRNPRTAVTTASIKKQNRVAIESVRNALQFQSDKRIGEVHGLLSGDLDEGSLHKLRYDSEHIWSQKTIARLPDVAVGILVDQSGSMSCGGKIANAREMCIVLAEAVKQLNGVHLHIYGHTANQNGSSDLTLFEHYSSYGDAKTADLSNLGAIEAYSNNYDGYAIKEAAKRLNLDPAKKKYLFIIADGFPAGSGYGGDEAEKHVTSVCSYVRTKLNIATYAFAVGNNNATERKRFEAQYGRNNIVFISNVKQALPKIVRFLRNALQKEKTLVDTSAD